MSDVALRASALGKQYRIGTGRPHYRTLRQALSDVWRGAGASDGNRRDDDIFWALRDVSFEVTRGEVVGVIGRNGAGKSTLLKLLSRITEPTAGYADIFGRVGSLLEVGTGFHSELTGRENVFLNGAILGMRTQEITRKFDEIVDFAEVAQFIDTPIKFYSTGMHLRLAFAVAAHLEPEILLVDEVLAVGDAAFQRKCLGKMNDVAHEGRTVLLVSHDMTAIAHLATRCLWLERGHVALFDETERVVGEYSRSQQEFATDLSLRRDRQGDGTIRMQAIRFLDGDGTLVNAVGSGAPLSIAIDYTTTRPEIDPRDIWLDMTFRDQLGHPIATVSTRFSPVVVEGGAKGNVTLICHVPSFALADERYSLDLWLAYRQGLSDHVLRAADITVNPSNYFGTGHAPVKRKHGAALLAHRWAARPAASAEVPTAVGVS